ncbi:hypothetical protein LO762_10470 [Actinocorallia sp. API 0066]|uniref:hypothetical protein n=1 Tax=Actinocorallia sp. API 0066 TaxID=2896846 RepID=UPI001E2FF65A|nr:hypothetical protein [Actinocorallia sp. API 0066]MCD0449611.1 hypothetical protein [Actinocorallia sp. API 0066]
MPVEIPARFNGPPGSGNGGYACAVFARAVTGSARGGAQVTLRRPPPLDTPLTVERGAGRILDGAVLIAEVGADAAGAWPVPGFVTVAEAELCHASYQGLTAHPFPTCFVCGTDRTDGLALTPGAVPGREATAACVWRPDPGLADATGEIGAEFVWAALDCPGAWTLDLEARPMVLGRMAATVTALPRPGEPHVVVAAAEPPRGRKVTSHTALYTADGTLLASATAVWIIIAEPG